MSRNALEQSSYDCSTKSNITLNNTGNCITLFTQNNTIKIILGHVTYLCSRIFHVLNIQLTFNANTQYSKVIVARYLYTTPHWISRNYIEIERMRLRQAWHFQLLEVTKSTAQQIMTHVHVYK